MSWTPEDRDLLTRCARSARAGEPANPGMLSRFYKTLASCRSFTSETLGEHDLQAALDALSVAGRPPMSTSRRAGVVLLELARDSPVASIRDPALDALTAYWTTRPPLDPSTPRGLYTSDRFDAVRCFRLALIANEEVDLDHANSLLPELALDIEELKVIHARVLARDVFSDATLDLLEGLYVHSTWLNRRILIRQIGEGHERAVPALARVAKITDPSTRRGVVSALARVAHVSAEPILIALLDDIEPGVARDIVDALATSGTRACLPRLSALRDEHPELAVAVDAATAQLDARFPISARPGALSLSEDGHAGALSLAGASPGDISLYADVERRLEETALAPAPATALVKRYDWHRLVTPTRDLPLGFTLRAIGVGRWGSNLLTWIGIGLVLLALDGPNVVKLPLVMAMTPLLLLGAWHHRRHRRLLRHGTSAFAEFIGVERKGHGKGRTIDYHYRYMDELEQTHEATFRVEVEVPSITDEPLEPILYMPNGEVMLFDEISYLSLSEDGALINASPWNYLGALGPALSLAGIAYTLSSVWP